MSFQITGVVLVLGYFRVRIICSVWASGDKAIGHQLDQQAAEVD